MDKVKLKNMNDLKDKILSEFNKEFNNGKASFWFTDEECYAVKEFLSSAIDRVYQAGYNEGEADCYDLSD